MEGIIDLSDKEFQHISKLVYEKFGINLTDKKKTLVRGRLNKLLRELGYSDFDSYYHHIMNDNTGRSLLQLVDKVSTNHTFFFRENDHFDFLRDRMLPQVNRLLEEGSTRDLRIWCAGCATGEEAYTIAIVLSEFFGSRFFTAGPPILATDISLTALEKAALGVYGPDRVQTLPPQMLHRYFTVDGKDSYRVKDELKKMVLFKRLNFKRGSFPFRGKFHAIFCRNVMIYFDQPTKEDLVRKFSRYIVDGGYFFIGHSETLGRTNADFTYVQPALYVKREH
jgi:chemotaxis protein methyltransferase CheR